MCCYDLSMFNTILCKKNRTRSQQRILNQLGRGGIKFWESCGMFQKRICDGEIPQVITGDLTMKGACLRVIHKQGWCEAQQYIKDFTGLEILWKAVNS